MDLPLTFANEFLTVLGYGAIIAIVAGVYKLFQIVAELGEIKELLKDAQRATSDPLARMDSLPKVVGSDPAQYAESLLRHVNAQTASAEPVRTEWEPKREVAAQVPEQVEAQVEAMQPAASVTAAAGIAEESIAERGSRESNQSELSERLQVERTQAVQTQTELVPKVVPVDVFPVSNVPEGPVSVAAISRELEPEEDLVALNPVVIPAHTSSGPASNSTVSTTSNPTANTPWRDSSNQPEVWNREEALSQEVARIGKGRPEGAYSRAVHTETVESKAVRSVPVSSTAVSSSSVPSSFSSTVVSSRPAEFREVQSRAVETNEVKRNEVGSRDVDLREVDSQAVNSVANTVEVVPALAPPGVASEEELSLPELHMPQLQAPSEPVEPASVEVQSSVAEVQGSEVAQELTPASFSTPITSSDAPFSHGSFSNATTRQLTALRSSVDQKPTQPDALGLLLGDEGESARRVQPAEAAVAETSSIEEPKPALPKVPKAQEVPSLDSLVYSDSDELPTLDLPVYQPMGSRAHR